MHIGDLIFFVAMGVLGILGLYLLITPMFKPSGYWQSQNTQKIKTTIFGLWIAAIILPTAFFFLSIMGASDVGGGPPAYFASFIIPAPFIVVLGPIIAIFQIIGIKKSRKQPLVRN